MQGKQKENFELISLIRNTNNKIKVIGPISIIKEIKHSNKKSLVKEKPFFKQAHFDYLQIIQKLIEEASFYLSSPFSYDNYKLNQKQTKEFNQFYDSVSTLSEDQKSADSNVLENQQIDDVMQKIKFGKIKGQINGDYFAPDGIDVDKWQKFSDFRKLYPALMVLKYALNPL